MKRLRYILYLLTGILTMTACTDDLSDGTTPSGGDKGTGEMVLFAAGTTAVSTSSRADGDKNDGITITPGLSYYMPKDFRFVCRMYYMASTGAGAKYDVKGGTDVITWLKVGDNAGNSLYWRNTFPTLDPTNSSLFDSYKNDAEATCLYWQNRKDHAFLAWTDLNRATEIGYAPEKNSNTLKFVPADVEFEKHSGGKVDQWVDNGFEVYGASNDFPDWETLREFMATGDNYKRFIEGKTPSGISASDFIGKEYYYAYGWSCKFSEIKAKTEEVDALHQKYGWIQYQMFYDKLKYNGAVSGPDITIKRNDRDVPAFLFNTATNKYLAEIEIKFYILNEQGGLTEELYVTEATDINARTNSTLDKTTVADGDNIKKTADGNEIARCVYVYNLTDEYGNVKYDESHPRYTFYYKKLQEKRNQEKVELFPANEFDLTRKPVKDADGNITSYGINKITEQPDICQALTKQPPLGATQESNRVNLYFKHQFSQIQVNIKMSNDLSVVINKNNIKKVELLGVTEKGYVFTELNADGEVENANYESVNVSKYSDEELKKNQYGTSFEMFDMATGKDAQGKEVGTDGAGPDAGYPTGYIKAYNAIAFGLLQAIRVTWSEEENGSGISHESTYKVANETLKNLRSGYKYIWNIELRRGTLAIVRTEIVDWIVPEEELEYGTNGTISN